MVVPYEIIMKLKNSYHLVTSRPSNITVQHNTHGFVPMLV